MYRLADQPIDAAHLAAYQRVCGFRVSGELPPTYLHVLAFPLSVALMTELAFPFPLVGLVHVANTITVHRPVRSDETVSFEVRAGDLRPHNAGRQLDLLADARVGDELVWTRPQHLPAPRRLRWSCRRHEPAERRPHRPRRSSRPRWPRYGFRTTPGGATPRCPATATRSTCMR